MLGEKPSLPFCCMIILAVPLKFFDCMAIFFECAMSCTRSLQSAGSASPASPVPDARYYYGERHGTGAAGAGEPEEGERTGRGRGRAHAQMERRMLSLLAPLNALASQHTVCIVILEASVILDTRVLEAWISAAYALHHVPRG